MLYSQNSFGSPQLFSSIWAMCTMLFLQLKIFPLLSRLQESARPYLTNSHSERILPNTTKSQLTLLVISTLPTTLKN